MGDVRGSVERDDPRQVLAFLNSLGVIGVTASQLKEFMKGKDNKITEIQLNTTFHICTNRLLVNPSLNSKN